MGFELQVSGFGLRGDGFMVRVSSLGFQVSGCRFRVLGFGFWDSDFRFRVSGFGARAVLPNTVEYYMSTSPIRKRPPPWDPSRTLGMVLL